MAFVATIPCALSTGPVGLVTGQTPLAQAGLGCVDCNSRGLGCPGCGGKCGGVPALSGLGLFDYGMDISQWGVGEWACVAGGAYLLVAMLGTTRRGMGAVKRKGKAMRRAIRA